MPDPVETQHDEPVVTEDTPNAEETAAQEVVEGTTPAEETGEEAATSQIPEGEEAGPGDPTADVEEEKVPRGVMRRITRAVRDQRTAERKQRNAENDRDYYKRLSEGKAPAPGSRPEAAPQATDDPEPKLEAFDDLDQFQDERSKWVARQEVNRMNRETTAKNQQDEAERQAVERDAKWESNIDIFIEKAGIDDFDEVVMDETRGFVAPAVADAIKDSENGPAIAYHLAKNPKESARINALSPLSAAREIGKLEAKLGTPKQPPAKKTTKAPAPIAPVGGNNEIVEKDLSDMTMDEYAAYRRKQEEEG